MKSLMSRLRRPDAPGPASPTAASATVSSPHAADWNKYDDRLMKAAERGDVEKVSSILAKKGVNPGKLDVEGRSAFHVVASKGNLECLNAILIHGVDITTSDSAGRNALHLAAKYGHALCLQKLLQYNCPTEHVDLQGRTALHDAAMADCPSSIQLLCDHGASVNAKDIDGRTPLVLATQMCRPTICQLLIDRGADINSRDKQNRTALMLGCEYGCKDAVEVLVKNGADVTLLDALGHDSSYYARIGDNLDLLTILKTASENTGKGKELWRKGPSLQQRNLTHIQDEVNMKSNQREHRSVQDLEVENEDLKERLRKIQQEQRILLDKVNGLQLQLNEEVMVADDLESEREKLKSLLAAKEKQHEESLRTIEALKSRFKYLESDHLGSGSHFSNRKEDMLLKQDQMYMTDTQGASTGVPAHLQSRSLLRPLELLPSQSSYSENEVLRKELEAMRAFCESAKQDRLRLQNELAHKAAECAALALESERVKEDSDAQVRQLEEALQDVQARMCESEGKVRHMQSHFLALKERLSSEADPRELEARLKDVEAKHEGASAEVARLRTQVEQSETLAEERAREEGRLREENRRLQRELGASGAEREKEARKVLEMEGRVQELTAQAALCVPAEKFEAMKTALSNEVKEKARQLGEAEREHERALGEARRLKRELEGVRAQLAQQRGSAEELARRHQALQRELEQAARDKQRLGQRARDLAAEMETSEETRRAHEACVADLNRKLADAAGECAEKRLESERLLADNERREQELAALRAGLAELRQQLSEAQRARGEEQERARALASENAELRQGLSAREEARAEAARELADAKGRLEEAGRECRAARDENEALRSSLERGRRQMQAECVSRAEHEARLGALSRSLQEARAEKAAAEAGYQRGREEIRALHAEMEAQKKELDAIQEGIELKYTPAARLEECERRWEAAERELRERLAEQTRECGRREDEARRREQESARLQEELGALRRELQERGAQLEGAREAERALRGRAEELGARLEELTRKQGAADEERVRAEALKASLEGAVADLRGELREKQRCVEQERQAASALRRRLREHEGASVPRADHLREKEALEKEVARVKASLREKEEESQHRTHEVSKLQTEVQSAKQALRKLEAREVVDLSKYEATKNDLETQVANLNEKLADLNRKYEEAREEALRAQKKKLSAKDEKELLHLSIEQEIKDQKERCDKSLTTVMELQRRIQESAEQIEAKDNKITELLNDVERLKQALNGLSQLTYTSGSSTKRQNQLVDTLQHQVKALRQQLSDADRQHQEVIAIYRTHLLSAAQGHMDEDVQAALLQIIQMRQGLVC